MADVTSGGKAVFTFSVTNAGNFVIEAVAHGPDDNSNSYFVNVDAMPADAMIWDVEVTDGFEKHLVNWRGSGDGANDEFSPKVFKLEPGKHQIILVGREPGTELKSIRACQ
jgi:P pilus assembly chaperone PapD